MGIIIGKFRKKKGTYDVLEKLENEITSIEEFGRSTEQYRKKVISRFIILAIFSFLVMTLGLYFFYHKISTDQRFLYFIPLLVFTPIVWLIKKFLTWYYVRKIVKNEKKLIKLKEEKKKILENVMETETYKVAKKILDKFGNDTGKKTHLSLIEATPKSTPRDKSSVPLSIRTTQTGLRQRTAIPQAIPSRLSYGPAISNSPIPPTVSLLSTTKSADALSLTPVRGFTPSVGVNVPSTPLQMPRSLPARERSVFDKMVDYLIGDGPSNRYALICQQCSSHNGMALQEEFEYLSFRCYYCQSHNPARKQRPSGPKFEPQIPLNFPKPSEDSSDSDSASEQQKTVDKKTRKDSSDAAKSSDFDILSDTEAKEVEEESARLKTEKKKKAKESGDAPGGAQDESGARSLMDVDESIKIEKE